MFKVKSRDSEACKIALQWFKEKAVIDDKGQRKIGLGSPLDFIYDMAVDEFLFFGIDISPLIPEFTKRKIISKALSRWLRYKKYRNNPDLVKAFSDAVLVELKNWEGNQGEFLIIAFLNLQRNDFFEQEELDISGDKVKIISWNETKDFRLDEIWKKGKEHLSKNLEDVFANREQLEAYFSPVLITVNSYRQIDALYKALESFDMVRVALNYASATGLIMKFGQTFPLSKFRSSPVLGLLDVNGNLVDCKYFDGGFWFPQQQKLKENEYEIARYIISNVVTDAGLWSLISNLLYLYQQALDLTNDMEVFLALWRVLEAAVLDGPERPVNIQARVAQLSGVETDPILSRSLKMLTKYRNDLVHKGDFPHHSHNLIFLLKKLVDITINRIIQLSKRIDSIHEYSEFLGLISINKKELERKAKALDLIQGIRSGKSAYR